MNNTSSILELVNKIPVSLYFSEIPDRQQALKYLDYLYTNIPASRQVDSDKLFREVISRELRGVSMKIIEPEILLLVALDKITLADFQLASDELVRKVIAQNPDKYDLDIVQRIMAQIMTKLPRDLRERVAGKHKLQIFQLIARQLNMNPQLLEKFTNYDPSLNNTVSMELDAGNYNTLNKKYLQELYNYQRKQPYISANSLEYGSLAAEMVLSQPTGIQSAQTTNQAIAKAQYIDESPSLMVGTEDKTLYYFDPSSGTLSEMPINKNQTPVSVQDLKTILASQKINQGDIQDAIDALKPTIPITTTATTEEEKNRLTSFISGLENAFSGLITGTTQAQATLQATANLAPTEPVPPAFLTKLYKLKHGEELKTGGNYSRTLSDNYTKMMAGLGGSNVSSRGGGYQMPGNQSSSQVASLPGGMYGNLSRPNFIPNTSTTGTRGYTQNEALPLFEITNPQTTYAAFSGRAPHETTTPQTTTTPPQTTTTSNPNSTSTSTIPSTSTSTSTSPITSTSTITSTITSTSTSPSTSTSTSTRPSTSTSTSTPTLTNKSSFANLGANSQVISTEQTVAAKIKKDTKNVERIAIGFITILILIFLIAVITYVKNAKSSS
jgi:hypothetical protein